MAPTAILFPRAETPVSHIWLARAEQARRIAAMLSVRDAELLEAYARECEGQAQPLVEMQSPSIAA